MKASIKQEQHASTVNYTFSQTCKIDKISKTRKEKLRSVVPSDAFILDKCLMWYSTALWGIKPVSKRKWPNAEKKKTHCNFSSEVIAELVFFPRDHILLCCWFVKNYDAFLEVDMTYVLYSYITASLKCSLTKTFQRKSNSEKRYVSKARGHCTTGIGWFALPTVSQTCSRCWTGRAALWLRFCSLFLCRNFLRATRAWKGLGATGFHLCFCRWYLVASFGGETSCAGAVCSRVWSSWDENQHLQIRAHGSWPEKHGLPPSGQGWASASSVVFLRFLFTSEGRMMYESDRRINAAAMPVCLELPVSVPSPVIMNFTSERSKT